MAIYENNAEGMSSGTTVAASQAGSGSAFANVTTTGSPTGVYDNSTAAHGSQSYHVTGASGTTLYVRFDGGGVTPGAVRTYLRLNALPSGAMNIVEFRDTAGQQNAAIGISTSGKLQLKDAGGTGLTTFATALTLGTWYRVEMQIVVGASTTTGTINGAYYVGDSTTPQDTAFTSTTANSGTANNSYVRFGKITSATTFDMHYDDIAWNNGSATPLGPYAAPTNQAPTCSAGTDQVNVEPYTTVTLAGSDNDSDGTVVTRAWRQISGSPTVTLSGASTATCTYIAPGTIAGSSLTFGYKVTDDGGTDSVESTVDHAILGVSERAAIGGAEVPIKTQVASGGALI